MNETRNHNAFVFLTTLSVCLGLMLVGSGAGLSAQSIQGNANLRVIVRQSLYGDALEEIVRELEKLRESGEDVSIDAGLLDGDTLLSLANLHDFVSKYSASLIGHSPSPMRMVDSVFRLENTATLTAGHRVKLREKRPRITITNLARASLDS